MKFLVGLLLVAMATTAWCEDMQMIELTPAVSSNSNCEVSFWCQDLETAQRCDKVSYCRKWIWKEEMAPESNVTCDDCKEVVTYLLKENDTIIEFICGSFPVISQFCRVELKKFVVKITPQGVCSKIDICPKSLALIADKILSQSLSRVGSNATCDDCKEVMGLILKEAPAVKTLLDDLCKKTGPVDIICEAAVDLIMKGFNKLNATYICTDVIHMCSKVSDQLLGRDECTRGPGYWCASIDNAKKCQAFDWCNEKYWV